MEKQDEKELISAAMAVLGRRTSEKKRKAVKANAQKRQLKPLADFPCTCGQCPDNPRTYCPRGRAILRRARNPQPNQRRWPNDPHP